jgi:hypothetical protein
MKVSGFGVQVSAIKKFQITNTKQLAFDLI